MQGMCATTGRALSGIAHIAQSIADILTTPIGTRIGRREYGSALHELIDQPMNALGSMRLFAAVATALARWEPRLRLTRVRIAPIGEGIGGRFAIELEGVRTDQPAADELTRLTVPIRNPFVPASI